MTTSALLFVLGLGLYPQMHEGKRKVKSLYSLLGTDGLIRALLIDGSQDSPGRPHFLHRPHTLTLLSLVGSWDTENPS